MMDVVVPVLGDMACYCGGWLIGELDAKTVGKRSGMPVAMTRAERQWELASLPVGLVPRTIPKTEAKR